MVALAFGLTEASPLPFTETFDELSTGDLAGQNGWMAAGTAALVQSVAAHQNQALELTDAVVDRDLIGTRNCAWLSFWACCTARPSENPSVEDPDTSFAFFMNTNGLLSVYSNTVPVELPVEIPTNVWTRFDVYCDYDQQTWDLSVNKTNVAAGLPLYSSGRRVSGLYIKNASPSPAYVDSITMADREPVADPVDTDGDTLPDWWEQRHFGTVRAGQPDAVSSNLVNSVRNAYIAGLDPNQTNHFRIERIDPDSRHLSWQAQYGRRYSVYWTTNLLDGFELVRSGITGDGVVDIPVTNHFGGFYRVNVELDTSSP